MQQCCAAFDGAFPAADRVGEFLIDDVRDFPHPETTILIFELQGGRLVAG